MTTLNKPELSIFEQELQAVVRDGNPIEQAQAFGRAREYQLSTRRLAALGGCSETHVRNMLELLDLPSEVQLKIADGEPYRPYLTGSTDARSGVTALLDVESAADDGCKCLLRWCEQLELSGGYAERALKEARLRIQWGEDGWVIPQSDVLWRGTPDEAFELFRQADYMNLAGFKQMNAASDWLAQALVYLMPNGEARKRAFDRALVELGAWATP
jgi:hypothetical protein